MQRVVIGLRKRNGKHKIPKFSECLIQYFAKDALSVNVNCSLENGILILNESEEGCELKHSPECPFKLLSNLHTSELEYDSLIQNDLQATNIGVATSVVIETSDSHVLLTKRSAQMRSSPNVWVVPGGHLEYGETIFEAGAREVKEETGLDICCEKTSILGLWENVYPLILGAGKPKHHVLVVYLYTFLNETHEKLTQKLIPNSEEVASYCWLDFSTLSKLFCSNENFNSVGKQFICENGEILEKNLNYNKMFNRWLARQSEPYSGVNYALRKWMQKIKKENSFCKF